MAIDSTSTFAQIEAEYLDTAGYLINDSPTEARRHAKAIRFLMLKIPATSTKGSNSVSYRHDLLQRELERAEEFARVRGLASVRRVDFRNMRENG